MSTVAGEAETGTAGRELAPRLGRWLQLTGAILGVAGSGLVVIARTGLVWFYGHFDVAPEEVGIDRSTLLFQTAAGGVAAVGLACATGSLALVVVATLVHRRRRNRDAWQACARRPGVLRAAAASAGLALLLWYVWGVVVAHEGLEAIRHGESVPPQMIAHGEIVATCVQVWWSDDATAAAFDADPGTEVVALGHAGGVDVFYDAHSRRTIRVPTGRAVTRTCGP